MSTNYYLHDAETDEELLHIGKSSGGWCFALHVYPMAGQNAKMRENWNHKYMDVYPVDFPIVSLKCWKEVFKNPRFIIKNEYGEVVSPLDMLSTITDRRRFDDEYQLRRHPVDDKYCIGNAHGTYDFIVGDFS